MTAALAANPTQRYRWVILLIATFAQACACFFVQGIGAIAVFIQNDLQLSSLQIGLLVSAAQLVPIVGLLVAGELLDRYSERLVVGLGTLIVALALCASLWATDLTILLFLVVVGAGYSTAQPAASRCHAGSPRPSWASPWASARPGCRWAARCPPRCCRTWRGSTAGAAHSSPAAW